MANLDHIAELRAELSYGLLTRRERAQIESELQTALAYQAQIESEFARVLDEVQPD